MKQNMKHETRKNQNQGSRHLRHCTDRATLILRLLSALAARGETYEEEIREILGFTQVEGATVGFGASLEPVEIRLRVSVGVVPEVGEFYYGQVVGVDPLLEREGLQS